MRIFIEPTEPLLFRTGRPFDVGENNFAESIFPPTPETLQGAVRAMIATYWNTDQTLDKVFQQPELVNLIGDRTRYGRFRITGISLGRRKKDASSSSSIERLFPMPSHLLREEDGEKRQTRLIPREKQDDVFTNVPDNMQLLYPRISEPSSKLEPMPGWLTENGLRTALGTDNDIAEEDIISNNAIYVNEQRMGIGMNNATQTTREGQLYQVQKVRMNPLIDHDYTFGFVIDVRLAQREIMDSTIPQSELLVDDDETRKMLRLPDSGWVTLGGERRAAHFSVIASQSQQNLFPEKQGTLLYLATPAQLDHGWRPQTWNSPLVLPIAASITRYQPIGGWLLEPGTGGGTNKTMYRCVPAGSVYFFDHSVTMPPFLTNHGWQIGYGITYTGVWQQ